MPAWVAPALKYGLPAAKGLLGFLGGRGRDKAAEAEARNLNRERQWRHKFDTAAWRAEKSPFYRGRDRSRWARNRLIAGLIKNPKYGLGGLLGGAFSAFGPEWGAGGPGSAWGAPQQITRSPHEVAGAPPQLEAQKSGTLANLAAGAAGALEGIAQTRGTGEV